LDAKQFRERQRGGAKIKFLVAVVVLGSLAFAAVKIVPAYFANYQLDDAMKTEARFATSAYPKKTVEDVREDIFKKVQELEVPAKKEDIRVTSDGSLVSISLDYSVTFDLAVTQFTRQFHLHEDSRPI
jgi:hypothetical protein